MKWHLVFENYFTYPFFGVNSSLMCFDIVLLFFLFFYLVYTFNIIQVLLGCVGFILILSLNLPPIGRVGFGGGYPRSLGKDMARRSHKSWRSNILPSLAALNILVL